MAQAGVADRRKPSRKREQLRALAVSKDGTKKVDCRIEDLSAVGARVFINKGQVIPEHFYFIIAGKETGFEATVAWSRAQEYGLQFTRAFQLEGLKNTDLAFLRQLKLERLRV